VSVTEPIFNKTHIQHQFFLKEQPTKFHENTTKDLVTEARSYTDGWTEGGGLHVRSFCYSAKNALHAQVCEDQSAPAKKKKTPTAAMTLLYIVYIHLEGCK
jgi:hypothetical protein